VIREGWRKRPDGGGSGKRCVRVVSIANGLIYGFDAGAGSHGADTQLE